jgi:hypothetical protein
MRQAGLKAFTAVLVTLGAYLSQAQKTSSLASDPLTETGQINANGRNASYLVHHLPPNAFPDLPPSIAASIASSGCLIPQTYAAHHPENVVHASLERAGSNDWALLCSNNRTVTLMVFFASAPQHPMILASAPETERLQRHDASQVLGFNWGIDPATPAQIHEAQVGMNHHPPALDHDALADSVIDHRTVYHLYTKGGWTLVDLPE